MDALEIGLVGVAQAITGGATFLATKWSTYRREERAEDEKKEAAKAAQEVETRVTRLEERHTYHEEKMDTLLDEIRGLRKDVQDAFANR